MQMRAGILVISDRGWRGERHDKSGQTAKEIISQLSIDIAEYEIVPDDASIISQKLRDWCDEVGLDLILTIGGTGLSARDVTPEATSVVVDKTIPGLMEAMRMETMKIKPEAILSRAIAGSRGKCLIINLPGSPKAVKECLDVILPVLPHAMDVLSGRVSDCGHGGDS
ncbi:MAG: MogA/MoaB family molybdenum cofactor biosynthesis protein [Dehalococcoidia bacterium]|nr:MogA/MoaB family molybdenum cofactor biosynthesis protein [Dehalococcoidia bacterium]